ncbi:hypothetical protein [Bacteroides sp.]
MEMNGSRKTEKLLWGMTEISYKIKCYGKVFGDMLKKRIFANPVFTALMDHE